MSRSIKKGPYVAHYLTKKVEKINESNKKEPIKTWSRRSMIIPEFVGHTFLVHNGKIFKPVLITSDMIGEKLGSYSRTRDFRAHSSKKKK